MKQQTTNTPAENTTPQIARFLKNAIKTVMEHNDYTEDMVTAEVCDKKGFWSPCDLIIREALNNGGGSAKGFLDMTKANCLKCYNYMVDNRQSVIDLGLVHEKGWNNFGIQLWNNYNF